MSEVLIEQCGAGRTLSVASHGVMSDGTKYTSTNLMDKDASSLVGCRLDTSKMKFVADPHIRENTKSSPDEDHDDVWWIRCRLEDGTYIATLTKGYDTHNAIVIEREPSESPHRASNGSGTSNAL